MFFIQKILAHQDLKSLAPAHSKCASGSKKTGFYHLCFTYVRRLVTCCGTSTPSAWSCQTFHLSPAPGIYSQHTVRKNQRKLNSQWIFVDKGGLKVTYRLHFNDIRLSLVPTYKYSLKVQFSSIFSISSLHSQLRKNENVAKI